jgi:penicillin-binding protein 1A
MMNKLMAFLAPLLTQFREFAATIPNRLRHPTKRGVLLTLAAIPALLVLYVLLLIPFTPTQHLRPAKRQDRQAFGRDVGGRQRACFLQAGQP